MPSAAGPSSSPYTFQPAALNTTQWADVMVALGAKGAILTAKHGCGHLLWPSKTYLPDGTPYPYRVGTNASFVKVDVLKHFQNSMQERGIRHGFYYSLTNNFFLNVRGHKAGYSPILLPGQVNVSQAEFEKIALEQVEELWTNYGALGEIWFDGGYTGDMAKSLQHALKKQPGAIGFGGEGISQNPATWIGTESGEPDCPNGIWSTGTSYCGDPNSQQFIPKTTDTTLQLSDHWFWTPPARGIRDLPTLINVYHDTVGSNGVLELDFAIGREGRVADEHEAAYRALGRWVRSCYGTPINMNHAQSKLNDTTWVYTLSTSEKSVKITADRTVIREDISLGQRVRSWKLTDSHSGATLASGSSVGNRRVALFQEPVSTLGLTLVVTAVAKPVIMQFDIFSPEPCALQD